MTTDLGRSFNNHRDVLCAKLQGPLLPHLPFHLSYYTQSKIGYNADMPYLNLHLKIRSLPLLPAAIGIMVVLDVSHCTWSLVPGETTTRGGVALSFQLQERKQTFK